MQPGAALDEAVKGAHTVFLYVVHGTCEFSMIVLMLSRMTNFWEHLSAEKEIAEGKAVADACKAAGVQHLIFSSLINTTEASKGKLPNIAHFDGKAKIEAYIRQIGVPASFVLPGLFMSGYFDTIREGDGGNYYLALPVSEEKAQVPLHDAAGDTGALSSTGIRGSICC